MSENKRTDSWSVPYTNLIILPDFNIRTDYGDIPELGADILENGCKLPLSGWRSPEDKDKFIVKDGHRRHEAMKWIYQNHGIDIICRMIPEPQRYNPEDRVFDMFTMNNGKTLTPLEQAEGVQRAINHGYAVADIAKKIGKTDQHVRYLKALNAIPQRLKIAIKNKIVTSTLVMDMVNAGKTDELVRKIDSGFITFQEEVDNVSEPESKAVVVIEEPKIIDRKITKKDMAPANSWSAFKKWARTADVNKMPPEESIQFSFLCKIMNNEVAESDYQEHFVK